MVSLEVRKISDDAIVPSYAHPGDAGLDLYANETVIVNPGVVGKIRTGIAMAIPDGYVGLCWDKSGLSMKHGIKVLAGVIDSGYRGELIVGVINLGTEPYTFEKGHKVMQMLIQKVEEVNVAIVPELTETHRGEKGFGSTGK